MKKILKTIACCLGALAIAFTAFFVPTTKKLSSAYQHQTKPNTIQGDIDLITSNSSDYFIFNPLEITFYHSNPTMYTTEVYLPDDYLAKYQNYLNSVIVSSTGDVDYEISFQSYFESYVGLVNNDPYKSIFLQVSNFYGSNNFSQRGGVDVVRKSDGAVMNVFQMLEQNQSTLFSLYNRYNYALGGQRIGNNIMVDLVYLSKLYNLSIVDFFKSYVLKFNYLGFTGDNESYTCGLSISQPYSQNMISLMKNNVFIQTPFNNINDLAVYYYMFGGNTQESYWSNYYESLYNELLIDTRNSAYEEGYDVGFGNGRNEGIQNANNYSFLGLFGAMIDAPLTGLRSLFNFEFLGINLLSFITSLLTIALITFVIKKLMGR